MKKSFSIILLFIVLTLICSGCGNNTNTNIAEYGNSNEIIVVSREDGSGTRGAFIELFGIEQKNDDGTKKDLTTKEAIIAKQTDVMMTNISGNKDAIGYISLGSLNNTVKAIQIESVTPTTDNVKNKTYPIARPFIITTKGEPSGVAGDFVDFILSAEGQSVVAASYIPVLEYAPSYAGFKPSGKIVVAGSSSVTPVMEKLKEAYILLNPNANIEIQQSDSSAGINGAIEGTCDIGMSSRELKDNELSALISTQIAIDGIAVIVNNNNTVDDLSIEQIRNIFTGTTLYWNEVTK